MTEIPKERPLCPICGAEVRGVYAHNAAGARVCLRHLRIGRQPVKTPVAPNGELRVSAADGKRIRAAGNLPWGGVKKQ